MLSTFAVSPTGSHIGSKTKCNQWLCLEHLVREQASCCGPVWSHASVRLQIKAGEVFHLFTAVCFPSEVKTERMTLQPLVLHIYSREVRRHWEVSDFCQTFVLTLCSQQGCSYSHQERMPVAIGREKPWVLTANVNSGAR